MVAQRQLLAVILLCLAWTVACRDFYDLLNVPNHATDNQIKRAYRKLALKYHPGKHQPRFPSGTLSDCDRQTGCPRQQPGIHSVCARL